jgi:hypothetical protein
MHVGALQGKMAHAQAGESAKGKRQVLSSSRPVPLPSSFRPLWIHSKFRTMGNELHRYIVSGGLHIDGDRYQEVDVTMSAANRASTRRRLYAGVNHVIRLHTHFSK